MRLKYLFFGISLLVIVPGIFALARYGLRLSIDFSGGSLLEIQNSRIQSDQDVTDVKTIFKSQDVEVASWQKTGNGTYIIRTKPIDNAGKEKVMAMVRSQYGPTVEERFETVGPVIGRELTQKAIQAVAVASIAIVIYIAMAFRKIPAPYSSWKFGVAAVVALLHDVLVVVGIFAILGHFYHVEIDSLFVTALLTIIGFSVHDTIVVFDRIRENLNRTAGKIAFAQVVSDSIWQTLGRSLSTTLTVLFMLLALILFGGETIRWFIIALFIGIFSGTYSSIFNAAPLLVVWEEYKRK